jgi:hypothetical protein
VPTVAAAVIVSTPAKVAAYVKEAAPLASVRAILTCGLAPLTRRKTGVPAGAEAKWKLVMKFCEVPCAGLDGMGMAAKDSIGAAGLDLDVKEHPPI